MVGGVVVGGGWRVVDGGWCDCIWWLVGGGGLGDWGTEGLGGLWKEGVQNLGTWEPKDLVNGGIVVGHALRYLIYAKSFI